MALVRVLSGFDNPNILVLFFAVLLEVLVPLLEFVVLRVVYSLFEVKCKGQVVKHILVHCFVIIFHVQVKSLFVADMEVVFDLVVNLNLTWLTGLLF